MTVTWLDDDTIERIVAGEWVDDRFGPLVGFAAAVRSLGNEAVPPMSPALERLLAGEVVPGRPRGRRGRVLTDGLSTAAARLAALGLAAKVGLGTAVAAAGVAGAGAAGVLPDQANHEVRRAIEAVTPVEFADGAQDSDSERFGDRVSSDATGESDGENGVDGAVISQEAPGAAHRPTDPGQNGHDRAGQTPAADHLPDATDDSTTTTSVAHGRPASPPSTVPPAAGTVPSTVPDHGDSDGD